MYNMNSKYGKMYLKQLDFLHAIQPRFGVHHLEYLNLFQSDGNTVDFTSGSIHDRKLAFPDLPVDFEIR